MAQLTPSALDAAEIRQAVDRVLSGPAYAEAEPGLLTRGVRWLLEQVAELVSQVISAGGDGVGVVLLAALIGSVALIVWRLLRRIRRDRGRPARPGGLGGRGAQDWQADAVRHEGAGEWAAALRCHYRALLAELVAAGMIDEVAGRTARGYLRDVVGAAPDAAEPMTAVTTAFEAAWYDRREVTDADVAALRHAVTAVRRRVLVTA